MSTIEVRCPYCGNHAQKRTGADIYPHRPDLRLKPFWACQKCDAYVGCHPGTENPLGTLADAPTRRARNRAHAAFDPMWRSGAMTRKEAYAWLRKETGIPRKECHISMMNESQCDRVAELCGSHVIVTMIEEMKKAKGNANG